jgi:hypothetical protein
MAEPRSNAAAPRVTFQGKGAVAFHVYSRSMLSLSC